MTASKQVRRGRALGWRNKQRQAGFSLVEIMVSLVVLSVGLLGISAMLITSLKNAQASSAQNQATIQAGTMMDVLRSNKPSAIVGQYNLNQYTCTRPSADNPIGAEQARWITSLQQQVSPTACGRIRCSSLTCEVSIRWDDSRGTGGSEAREYIVTTRL